MRWVAGSLLVCAAILKAAQLLYEPAFVVASPSGHIILPIQIGIELAFGLILLSGLYWGTVRWLSALLFTSFAGYSLYLATNGATTCGCFGPLHIHPWWTFALDVAVVFGLLACAPVQPTAAIDSESGGRPRPTVSRRWYLVAVLTSICVLATALLARNLDRRTAVAEGLQQTSTGIVILEPEKWIGKKLPIADFIDVDLSIGNWIVLLHRHDCPVCRELAPQYEQRASDGERVSLIEVPPCGEFVQQGSRAQHGRLKDDRDWFVHTPVEIQLHDGVVMVVKSYDK